LYSLGYQEKDLLREIHATYMQLSQKSANTDQVTPESITSLTNAATTGDVSFKQDIEDEANSYYEKIYSGDITIEDMMNRLRKFSSSNDPREQDIFACMIHNLFDEYHFFPKYPDKELAITSILFGQLIQSQLVSYAPLGIALRCVLDALGNAPGSKMHNFGLQALAQFQSRLPEWPQYCAHLLQIPSLQQANPELIHLVKSSMQMGRMQQLQQHPQAQDEGLVPDLSNPLLNNHTGAPAFSSNAVAAPVIFTAIHVPEMSLDEGITYEAPNEATQDKILFIINNVALNNLRIKSSDLKENLKQTAYQWFSHYLVVKRASIEPNYHDLYLLLLKSVNSSLLYQHVLRETFANIKILLNSENTVSSSTERTLLKNLGAWLGGMTLAQNKPIIQKFIAFKELLLEGYDTNRLIVVIPFVCKVLEQGTKNKVFVPPNPWVMAILKLLVELYQNADLKLNLKFEIEVLCKSLSVELSSIEPTMVLKTRKPKNKLQQPITTAVVARNEDSMGASAAAASISSPFGPATPLNNNNRPPITNLIPQSEANAEESSPINIPNLGPYLTFNPQIVMYTAQPTSKRWVLQAVTQSIREIIGPVVERSVAIASVSTRELVAKDFSMESDENKMRKAAHLMAQSLAGSLAMVTCKDPLRTSMVNHLRALFIANGLSEIVAEQAALLTVADNLDLVCAVIEKTAMEKVTVEVDESLMNAYANRKKHREQRGNGQPYFDIDVLSMSRYPSTLPEPLRPKPNGLQPNQLRVYEDFIRIPRSAAAVAASSAGQMMDQQPMLDQQQQRLLRSRPDMQPLNGYNNNNNLLPNFDMGSNPQQQQQQQQVSAHQILERFAQYINELEKLVNMTHVHSFSALPMQHDIILLVRQIPLLAMSSFDKAEAARTFAQKVVQLLYKSESQLGREMYVVLLERLCDVAPNVGALVTSWLTHADDERKYNVPVTVALIKANLINLPEQDQELANLIDNGRISAIDFTARLIRSCLFDDVPLANHQEFMASLEALSRLRGNVPESVLVLMEEMRRRSAIQASSASNSSGAPTPLISQQLQKHEMISQNNEDVGLREHLRVLFTEWVRIYQHPTSSDKILNAFVLQLSQQGIFKMEDVSSLFYRVCIETSVEHAINYKQLPGQSPGAAYQPIDAFSKLVICLLKLQQPSAPAGTPTAEAQDNARIALFNKVLSIIVLVTAQHHEQRQQQFNQRPFLRLFTGLFSDLHAAEQQMQTIYIPILTAMSNTFHTLQPLQFPGFTFAWLQLISHRLFMPKLLLAENQKVNY
jgi:CCR4-NOT transcription complex subunit 1